MPALLKQWAGEKNAIVSLNVKVEVTLPTNLDSGSMPNETSLAVARGYKKISGHVVYAVVQALPPPDHPVCIGTDVMGKIGANVRMKIVEVNGPRAGVGEDPEVVANRKQRIEGLQIVVVSIVIAACHVGTKADARPRWHTRQCHTKL